MVNALDPSQIEQQLKELPTWSLKDKAIEFNHSFPSYLEALGFVHQAGLVSEQNDHHPDMRLNYKHVTVRFWTHSVDGISDLDFKMARKIEAILDK